MSEFVQGEVDRTTLGQLLLRSGTIWPTLKAFWQEDEGQDMVEYALLLAFVALAGVSLLSGIGTSIKTVFTGINTSMAAAARAAS